jgi:RimJ/RimL family protein N-acetyltransferase
MEKFMKIFNKNLKTQRLELRILEPTLENAKLVWDVLKNEKKENFSYIHFSPKYDKPLPESLEETLETMKNFADSWKNYGVIWYVFHNGNLIGNHGIGYNKEFDSVNGGNVWFIKSAWGHGFNREVHDLLEKMVFEELKSHRMVRQCMANNERSQKSITGSGFKLEGRLREHAQLPDGTWTDHLIFSKLKSEYRK